MAQKVFSFKQYRAMDLFIFALIFAIIEAALTSLANKFINGYCVSLFYVIIALVVMRWGWCGVFHAIIGGIVFVIASQGDYLQMIAFAVGNTASMLVLIFTKLVGKEKIKDSFLLSMLYLIIIYLATCLGRATLLSILKQVSFFEILITAITTDAFSLVIGFVIIFICRKQDGLFEDQKDYLLRTEEERRKQLQNTNYEE